MSASAAMRHGFELQILLDSVERPLTGSLVMIADGGSWPTAEDQRTGALCPLATFTLAESGHRNGLKPTDGCSRSALDVSVPRGLGHCVSFLLLPLDVRAVRP
jgi:hypothetical protein